MSVAEAQQKISSFEFTQWIAYFSIEPFGHNVDHMYQAQVAAMVGNTVKKGSPLKVGDLMFNKKKKNRYQTPEEKASFFHAFAQQHNSNLKALKNG